MISFSMAYVATGLLFLSASIISFPNHGTEDMLAALKRFDPAAILVVCGFVAAWPLILAYGLYRKYFDK